VGPEEDGDKEDNDEQDLPRRVDLSARVAGRHREACFLPHLRSDAERNSTAGPHR